jgi:hypothetical protein
LVVSVEPFVGEPVPPTPGNAPTPSNPLSVEIHSYVLLPAGESVTTPSAPLTPQLPSQVQPAGKLSAAISLVQNPIEQTVAKIGIQTNDFRSDIREVPSARLDDHYFHYNYNLIFARRMQYCQYSTIRCFLSINLFMPQRS